MKFHKMHGLSNDFVIIDARHESIALPEKRIAELANRKSGIGFDQLVILKDPPSPRADIFMDMYNADGSSLEACGNASRCVASLLMRESNSDSVVLQTVAGLLEATADNPERTLVSVDMGEPKLDWRDIPLAEYRDTLKFDVQGFESCGVSMGNPHCVIFVGDAETVCLEEAGPAIENDPLFPRRTNVEFVSVQSKDRLRMRVWERGAGVTAACGSGACASVVAAVRRGLADRKCSVLLDGGILEIFWRKSDNRVLMTGPATYVYEGRIGK